MFFLLALWLLAAY
ncbi:hypothetical protein EYZ11_011166 [Aspergillus tanneri]|uniref:Uncharacterized protein n=1 Tax=Aspergillus tanneri TaxID=1220188 RepID=A0A4S3J5M8_9EURO|nr:hypothetical protein EYZ11_011166 [Aspergillus tanneri]